VADNIVVQGLCKSFDNFKLDQVSFRVPQGRIVGFIGENGAGKSTTIRLILNELKKDTGKVEIFGKDNTEPSTKDKIGVVFDESNFHDVFHVKDIGKILSGVYPTWDNALFYHCLEKFHLPADKAIGGFSRGMKMKLSIICAIAHKPKLLLLDEATSGLDPVVRDEMLDLFLDFIQDEECSILVSSHIISDIEKIADYVVLIHQGKIIFEEQKDKLLYHYGIAKCRKEQFQEIAKEDYLMSRQTRLCTECLVTDREFFRRNHKDIIVDRASLEEIMLFYAKGGQK